MKILKSKEGWFLPKVQLYFPATIMLQYFSIEDIGALVDRLESETIEMLKMFLIHDPTLDKHSTVAISPTLKRYYIGIIRRLQNMRLGVDVVIYVVKDSPVDVDLSSLTQFMLTIDPNIAKKLKIRKSIVAQRIFLTDLVFQFYYFIQDNYPEILELHKEVQTLLRKVTSFRQGDRAYSIVRGILGTSKISEGTILNVWYPYELNGFVSQNFFSLGFSDVVRLGLLWHLATQQYYNYFPSGKHPHFENLAPLATEAEQMLEERLTRLASKLRQVVMDVKGVIEEVSPIEEFLVNNLPTTHIELFAKARQLGVDLDELVRLLNLYIRWGRIVTEGEVLKWNVDPMQLIQRRGGNEQVQGSFGFRI